MKYRKKPVVIDAEQFYPHREPWPEGVEEKPGGYCTTADDGDWCVIHKIRHRKSAWKIETLEGPYAVQPGDWIITGVKGERYPCKPDIFEMTYDPC